MSKQWQAKEQGSSFWINVPAAMVTLYASTAKLAGDMVECLRIRPSIPAKVKSAISDERLSKALDQIKAGTYTAEKLRQSFKLTEQQLARVTSIEEEMA